jgi:cyanophycinase-like exopeptidase
MTGLVCLQGGAEFTAPCRPMDAEVLRLVGATGRVRVVVTALAGAPGRDARTAEQHALDHYGSLGADVVAAPDARDDVHGALEVLRTADLVVLPGGSPSRLLDALTDTGVGGWLVDAVRGGTAVSGSSAGAMVLGRLTVVPDRPGGTGPSVEPGLGLAEAVVVPHWTGRRDDWLGALRDVVPSGVEVLGVPEACGAVIRDGALTALGAQPLHLLTTGRALAPGQVWQPPAGGRDPAS